MDYRPDEPRRPFEVPPDRPIHPLERRPPSEPTAPNIPPPQYPVRRIEVPQSTPIFSYVILGINILVFLADIATNQMLTQLGAKYNPGIIQGEYWRFITPMFLHAGFIHIAANSYFLYIVGPQVERAFGHFRFLAIYFLSGFAASIASFTFGHNSVSVGASGALFGLIGALLPLIYRNRNVLANSGRRIGSILQVIIINLILGFAIPYIDYWAHIGGLIGGLALAWLTTPRYAVRYALTGEAERIEDETSPAVTWFWYGFIGVVLIGLAFFAIQLQR